jgi:hypothetical protein
MMIVDVVDDRRDVGDFVQRQDHDSILRKQIHRQGYTFLNKSPSLTNIICTNLIQVI